MFKPTQVLSTLATLCMSALPASAVTVYSSDQQQFDIFGKVQAVYGNDAALQAITNDDTLDDGHSLTAKAQLGLAARSELTEGVSGVMTALWETDSQGELNTTRYLFAGIDAANYGTLLFGRGDAAFYTVVGATDTFSALDSTVSEYYTFGDQRPGMVMYSLSALSWDLRLSYQWAQKDMGESPVDLNYGISAALSTKFGEDITFAYGVDYSNFGYDDTAHESYAYFAPMVASTRGLSLKEAQDYQEQHRLRSRTDYAVALSYGTYQQPGLYAALVLGTSEYKGLLDHHLYYGETLLSYRLSNGFSMAVRYGSKKYENLDPLSELSLGLYYDMSASFRFFAEAQYDLGGDADIFYGQKNLTEDKFALGLELVF